MRRPGGNALVGRRVMSHATLGDTEVEQDNAATIIQLYILRLDIAMDHRVGLTCVQVDQRIQQLLRPLEHSFDR